MVLVVMLLKPLVVLVLPTNGMDVEDKDKWLQEWLHELRLKERIPT